MWLISGDRNTTFFHKQYRACLSRNHIFEISSADGTISKGIVQVKEADDIYFQHLFTEVGIGNEELTYEFISHIPSLVSEENN